MAEVVLSGLTKVFPGGVRAVDELDLTIHDGEFFALLGPSGCGKTTLLRTLAGLETPTSGTITIDGRDVTRTPPGQRNLAMVFQDYALYPHMTVTDNIAYPLKVRRVAAEQRRRTAAEAARELQLEQLLDRRPGQLSGGQQQRVALARAIAYHPGLFLFDEPLSNLDARLRLEARTFLKRLQAELGVTTVYVTHDQSEALALADRMAVMDHGRFRQVATPLEVYRHPASRFVAAFIGSVPMNLLDAVVEDGRLRVGGHRLPVPAEAAGAVSPGDEVVLGVRPEHATLHREETDAAIGGTVAVVELLGNDWLVTVEDGDLTVQVVARDAPEHGSRAWVSLDPDRSLLYGAGDGEVVAAPRQAGPPAEQEAAAGGGG